MFDQKGLSFRGIEVNHVNLGEEIYEKAYEKAEKEKTKAIAMNMIAEGDISDDKITKVTGLSVKEVRELKELQPV